MRSLTVVVVTLGLLVSGTPVVQSQGNNGNNGNNESYIVVLNASSGNPGQTAEEHSSRCGARPSHVYEHALRGYAARIPSNRVDCVRSDSRVSYIEPDQEFAAVVQTTPWGVQHIGADGSSTIAGNGSGAVSNVNVYIIDTGIYSHPDLYVVKRVNFVLGEPNSDCHGHGTHVAGTVSARDNTSYVVGVSPGSPLTAVKVLGCLGIGLNSAIIKGVDWVTANAIKPAVANMSLGGGVSQALDDAVRNSANKGVFYALAAGNSGANACNTSPARAGTHDGVMTTAAIDSNNQEASFSNYGSCVDVWAPGVNVLSTRRNGGTTTMSGTSMASPHVAGTGSLYLSSNTAATAAGVESALKSKAVGTGTTSKDGRPITMVYAGDF